GGCGGARRPRPGPAGPLQVPSGGALRPLPAAQCSRQGRTLRTVMTSRRQGAPVRVEVDPPTLLDALEQHRARLLGSLAALDDAAWATPSRCAGWSVADVVAHLRWGTDVGLELVRRVEGGSG